MPAIDFKAEFDAFYAGHQKVWKHDRSKTVGASESFGCLRKAWFAKHGTAKDHDYEESWGALERGNLIEDHFMAPRLTWIIERAGGKLIYAGQKTQRTLIDNEAPLSVTPDGIAINLPDDFLANYGIDSLGGTGCVVTEFKSIDPRVNLREEKAQHHGQAQIQLGLIRDQTRYKPNYALIFYVDASFFDDIEVFIVPWNPTALASARERAKIVFDTKQADVWQLLPEGKIDGACQYCPFKEACAKVSGEATPTDGFRNQDDLPLELQDEFLALVTAERALTREEKGIKEERAEASEKLRAFFREIGSKRLQVGDFKATITWNKGRKTYDIPAMKADGIDVEKYARQGDGFDTLRITETGGNVHED
jgi:CRISPR/Cas system-associated exonuclease Cas4 (RecB family)